MKVAIISTWKTRCGIANYTKNLSSKLKELETEVIVIDEESWSRNSLSFLPQVTEAIRHTNPDIVHFQHEYALYGDSIYAIPPMILPKVIKKLGWNVVTTIHSVFTKRSRDISCPKRMVRNTFTRFLSASSAVIVHINAGKEILVRDFKFDSDRIYMIPHGTKVYDISRENEDPNTLLYFGFIFPEKGIEHMVDAMPLILKDHPDVVLKIGGSTHPNNGRGEKYFKFLRRKVGRMGLSESVNFLGYLSDDELNMEIAKASICIFPYTKREAVCASGPLNKAAGFGKPMICTSIFHEVFPPSNMPGPSRDMSCMVVPPRNSNSIAEAVKILISDAELRRKLGENSKKNLAFSWENSAKAHLNVYKDVINQ